jgi:hypothetical protein
VTYFSAPKYCPILHDLACRFAVAPSDDKHEDLLMASIILSIKSTLFKSGSLHLIPRPFPRSHPMYVLDPVTVVNMYVERFSVDLPALDLSWSLFTWAILSVKSSTTPDMVQLFFQLSYDRLWAALDPSKENLPMTDDRAETVMRYAGQVVSYTAG